MVLDKRFRSTVSRGIGIFCAICFRYAKIVPYNIKKRPTALLYRLNIPRACRDYMTKCTGYDFSLTKPTTLETERGTKGKERTGKEKRHNSSWAFFSVFVPRLKIRVRFRALIYVKLGDFFSTIYRKFEGINYKMNNKRNRLTQNT